MTKHLPAARQSAFYWQGQPSVIGAQLARAAHVREQTSDKVAIERAAGRDPSDIPGVGTGNKRQRYSPSIEGREAGQRAGDKHAALKRSRI